MKIIYVILIVLGFVFANAQNIIGTSTQSTATERNNARLIAEDNNGNLHVAYYDNGIYYSFSEDAGANWSIPVLVDETGRNPSIMVDSYNILHLVYKYGGINAYDIVHRTYGYGVWSEPAFVYHDANFISPVSRPVIAFDGFDHLHCVWQRAGYGSTPNSEILFSSYIPGLGWADNYVNISDSYGASEYPALTIDGDNNVYVFWKDSGENIGNDKMVLYRKFTVGVGWDANYTNISNTSGNGSYATMDPSAVTDIDGNIHLVWKDSQTGNREIFYKKCTDGVWDTNFTNISNTAQASAHPSISTDNQGNLRVFWAEKIGGVYYEIVYSKYDVNIGNWTELTNISNSASVESEHPNAPIISNNSLSIIWTEDDDPPFSVMYYGELLPVGINYNINKEFSFNIFPNPTSGIFNIEGEGVLSIEITNIKGQFIIRRNIENDKRPFDLSALPNGVYFIKVFTDKDTVFEKIIKQ